MKVEDLRTMAKNAPPDVMLKALAETYKKVPKDKKEDLDAALTAILSGAKGMPKVPAAPKAPKTPPVDLDILEAEISKFTDNAYDGNYYYRNNKISKANRPKWRFEVMRFLKALDGIPQDHPDYDRVADLYITLYKLLSHAYVEHTFHGDDPFHSINYTQDALLKRMVEATLSVDDSPEKLYELIHVICRGHPSTELSHYDLQFCLLPFLNTPELREAALEQAMAISEKYIKRLGPTRTFSFVITVDVIEDDNTTEHVAEMVLQIALAISPEKFLGCLDFYYAHCFEDNHEIALYRALRIPRHMMHTQKSEDEPAEGEASEENDDPAMQYAWVAAYEDALQRDIKPRESLQKEYAEYKASEAYQQFLKEKEAAKEAAPEPESASEENSPRPLIPKELDRMERKVQRFVDDALAGKYSDPDGPFSNDKRYSWSGDIRRILDRMDEIPEDTPGYERVASLYITLYETLSEGLRGELFPQHDPFQAIHYGQELLLNNMVYSNLEAEDSPEMLRKLIEVLCSSPATAWPGHRRLQRFLLPVLEIWEDLDLALQVAMSLSEESIQWLGSASAHGDASQADIEKKRITASNLADLVLQIALAISPEKYLSCLDFFFAHAEAPNQKCTSYTLSRALETISDQMDPPEYKDESDEQPEIDQAALQHTWVAAYEDGLQRGIQPDRYLQKHYAEHKEHLSR